MSIFNEINHQSEVTGNFEQLTLGTVVDTSDPQQMGRVRIACPYFGDHDNTIIGDIPWATPISPLAGTTTTTRRGRENSVTAGIVAYGMFNTPKIGSTVVVACIEGDPKFRIYLGSMHDQFTPHTLPHGRYTYNTTEELTDEPSGPLSSSENFIQPLYGNQTEAFTKSMDNIESGIPIDPRKNFEYRTRGADRSVAGVDGIFIGTEDVIFSNEPDDKEHEFIEPDGNVINHTQGYEKSRVEEGLKNSITGDAYDTQTYSWTTPGFHSVSMDDSADNCRIRMRSTHGHQVIMDDTNERIYISTAGGKTWIEMDEQGNIDIFGERNISVHAEKDINFTAGDTFRVNAKNGIHLVSENEIRMHSKGDFHVKSDATLRMHSIVDTILQSETRFNINGATLSLTADTQMDVSVTGGTMFVGTSADIDMKAGGVGIFHSTGVLSLKSDDNIIATGDAIHLNGPPATSGTGATPALLSEIKDAWWTNRIPEHEPWGRIMTDPESTDTDSKNTHTDSAEYFYEDVNVGKTERGESLNRNEKWHR